MIPPALIKRVEICLNIRCVILRNSFSPRRKLVWLEKLFSSKTSQSISQLLFRSFDASCVRLFYFTFAFSLSFFPKNKKRKFPRFLHSSQMFWWSSWVCLRECGWGNFPFEWKRKTFSCFFSLVSCPEVFRSSLDYKIRPQVEDNLSSSNNGYQASRKREKTYSQLTGSQNWWNSLRSERSV